MDPTEQQASMRTVHPYGFRVVIADMPTEDTEQRLVLPESVLAARLKRGIVVDAGSESGLETGAVVFYRGEPLEIGDSLVIEMSQIVAWEDAL